MYEFEYVLYTYDVWSYVLVYCTSSVLVHVLYNTISGNPKDLWKNLKLCNYCVIRQQAPNLQAYIIEKQIPILFNQFSISLSDLQNELVELQAETVLIVPKELLLISYWKNLNL